MKWEYQWGGGLLIYSVYIIKSQNTLDIKPISLESKPASLPRIVRASGPGRQNPFHESGFSPELVDGVARVAQNHRSLFDVLLQNVQKKKE